MWPVTDDRLVVFLHVPKAGGQTVRSILGRVYGGGLIDFRGRLGEPWTPPTSWAGVRAVEGHLLYGVHVHTPRPVWYLTVLRDPVARVVSLYRYAARRPTHHLHTLARDLDLAAFVDHPSAAYEVHDTQTRQVAGVVSGAITDDHLDVARTHLAQDSAVAGAVEELDLTLVVAAERLGWPMPWYRRRNTAGGAPSIDATTEAAIRRRTTRDAALYRWVREQLARTAAARPGLRRRARLVRAVSRTVTALGR